MAPTISWLRSYGPSKMGNCQVSWSINNKCISLKGVKSVGGNYGDQLNRRVTITRTSEIGLQGRQRPSDRMVAMSRVSEIGLQER